MSRIAEPRRGAAPSRAAPVEPSPASRALDPALAARLVQAVTARPGATVLDLAGTLGVPPAAVAAAVLILAKSDALRLPEPPLRA